MHLKIRLKAALMATSAFALATASAAAAQETTTLGEIVVTAERRAGDVQDVAASVNVQTGNDLLTQGRYSLQSVLENVPGVAGGGAGGVGYSGVGGGSDSPGGTVAIRGISSNGPAAAQTISGVPATAYYVDDVYGGLGGGYDIDRVEVLRGPQGTLYGRSATAGVIAIHTRDPNLTKFGAEGLAEVGSDALRHVTGIVNAPLVTDKLAVRLAADHYERDGYDSAEGGAVSTTSAKLKVLFQPNEAMSALVGVGIERNTNHSGGSAGLLVAPNTVSFVSRPVESGENEFRQVWAELNWDLGPAVLTYVPALRTWDQDAANLVTGPGGQLMRQTLRTPNDNFVTHELRLASDKGAPSWLSWQAGLFYYNNDVTGVNDTRYRASNALLVHSETTRETKDIGAFGEATIAFSPALRLTAGLRYDETTVQTNQVYTSNANLFSGFGTTAGLPELLATVSLTGDAGRREFQNSTYKLRLEYDVTPANLVYGSVSSGFLPGDVQVTTGAGGLPVPVVFDSETLTAYEIGSKNRFLGDRLQVNGSLFYYEYGGYQTTVLLDPNNPGSATPFSVPMRTRGGEIEALYQLTDNDRVGLNAGVARSKFNGASAQFRSAVSQSGLWGYPPVSATLSYDHDFDFGGGSQLTFHADANYRSAYDVTSISPGLLAQFKPYIRQDAVTLWNANVTWSSADERYSVTGYVRNIGDERYKMYLQLQTQAASEVTLSDPRTIGVVLRAKL